MQLKHAQLLDELAILWVVMACYWLWYPEFALPPPYRCRYDASADSIPLLSDKIV